MLVCACTRAHSCQGVKVQERQSYPREALVAALLPLGHPAPPPPHKLSQFLSADVTQLN